MRLKRLFDILLSISILIFFFPVLTVMGILIKIEDDGPVIFQHFRVGKDGIAFPLYKLRSMTDKKVSEAQFDAGDPSRVTKIGSFLRKTKLDEIPQFFNVLRGDMSIVGPRPEIRKWVNTYPDRWDIILKVKPGITDPASIAFRNEENILSQAKDPEKYYREVILPQKLAIYETYINEQSFNYDLHLVKETIYTVIFK